MLDECNLCSDDQIKLSARTNQSVLIQFSYREELT